MDKQELLSFLDIDSKATDVEIINKFEEKRAFFKLQFQNTTSPRVKDTSKANIEKLNAFQQQFPDLLKDDNYTDNIYTDINTPTVENELIINNEIYKIFIDSRFVPRHCLEAIVDKYLVNKPLTKRESAVFTAKVFEIEEIIDSRLKSKGETVDVTEMLNKANQLLDDKKYIEAKVIFELMLSFDKDNITAKQRIEQCNKHIQATESIESPIQTPHKEQEFTDNKNIVDIPNDPEPTVAKKNIFLRRPKISFAILFLLATVVGYLYFKDKGSSPASQENLAAYQKDLAKEHFDKGNEYMDSGRTTDEVISEFRLAVSYDESLKSEIHILLIEKASRFDLLSSTENKDKYLELAKEFE